MVAMISEETDPAGILPGHQARVETRMCPSYLGPNLPPLKGPLLVFPAPPLSFVKRTRVSLSIPCLRKVSRTLPVLASISETRACYNVVFGCS
jgi:hypothetical protein